MIGVEWLSTAPPSLQALVVIAVVLFEAVLLYAGYGVLEDAIAPAVFERLERS